MATLRYVIYASNLAEPSAAQILAGQDVTGATATAYGSETARSTTGEEIFASNATGLSPNTSYKVSFVWWDTAFLSNVTTSGAFSTLSAALQMVRRVRTTQPKGAGRVNWANPLTRGTQFLFTPSSGAADSAQNRQGSFSGATYTTGASGYAIRTATGTGTTNYAEWSSAGIDCSKPFTWSVVVKANAAARTTFYDRVFHAYTDGGTSKLGFIVASATDPNAPGSLFFAALNSSGADVGSWAAGVSALSTTRYEVFSAVYNGATGTLYRNGIQVAQRSATTLMTASLSIPLRIGCPDNTGSKSAAVDVALAHITSGAWSSAQAAQFAANPWQLFAANDEPFFFTQGAGTSVPVTINATTGTAYARGLPATVASSLTISALAGAAAARGLQAIVASAITVTATPGTAFARGLAATVTQSSAITANTGAAVASGLGATVSSSITLTAGPGTAFARGLKATVASPITLTAGTGAAAAAGLKATVSSAITITAGPGQALAAGLTAAEILGATIIVCGSPGAAVASGLTATIADGSGGHQNAPFIANPGPMMTR